MTAQASTDKDDGVGVEGKESTHREDGADVYTTPGPGKPQTSTFHHWKLYPWHSMDGPIRRRRDCGTGKNPSHPPDAELKPTLGMQGGVLPTQLRRVIKLQRIGIRASGPDTIAPDLIHSEVV